MQHQTASHLHLKNGACNSYKQMAHSENIKVSIITSSYIQIGKSHLEAMTESDAQQTRVTITITFKRPVQVPWRYLRLLKLHISEKNLVYTMQDYKCIYMCYTQNSGCAEVVPQHSNLLFLSICLQNIEQSEKASLPCWKLGIKTLPTCVKLWNHVADKYHRI